MTSPHLPVRPQLSMVYGIFADPSLMIIEFEHVLKFDDNTIVFGVEIEHKNDNEFLTISPFDLDESDYEERYTRYLNVLYAEVEELVGDRITAAQRNMWEKKLRHKKPQILVGVRRF